VSGASPRVKLELAGFLADAMHELDFLRMSRHWVWKLRPFAANLPGSESIAAAS